MLKSNAWKYVYINTYIYIYLDIPSSNLFCSITFSYMFYVNRAFFTNSSRFWYIMVFRTNIEIHGITSINPLVQKGPKGLKLSRGGSNTKNLDLDHLPVPPVSVSAHHRFRLDLTHHLTGTSMDWIAWLWSCEGKGWVLASFGSFFGMQLGAPFL